MSVINKMLRDLDSRQTEATAPIKAQQSRTGIARDTLIVNDPQRLERRRRSPWVGLLLAATLVLSAGLVAAWWYLTQNVSSPRRPEESTVAAVLPNPVALPAAVPVVQPVSAPESEPVLLETPLKIDHALSQVPVPMAVPIAREPVVPKSLPQRAANVRGAAPVRPAATPPVLASSVATAAVGAAATAAPAAGLPRQSSAALEVLAQAQSRWNEGAHESAIDVLREALGAAERASLTGLPSGSNATLAVLARELARMELAEGRVQQALELLKRLEPALSGVADVWALRGNAAQRLGHHAESVAAYQMALKLRPNEPRWMLGAAVSLAAQGQTAAAAELAEKARSGGVLSPEVATYLRQLGVTLRER